MLSLSIFWIVKKQKKKSQIKKDDTQGQYEFKKSIFITFPLSLTLYTTVVELLNNLFIN